MRDDSPVFIVGMPRSGTTLMRGAVEAYPEIAIAPETHFLNFWVPRSGKTELESRGDFDHFWAAFVGSRQFEQLGLPPAEVRDTILSAGRPSFRTVFATVLRAYAEKAGKRRWGEKTPLHHLHIGRLLEWFPDGRIIYMLRDPRAVVASLQDAPWAAPGLELHACRWRDSVRVLAHWESDPRVCVVFYEALVTEPAAAMRKVGECLGERFDPALLTRRQVESGHGVAAYGGWAREHFGAASGPIRSDSISRWQERLTPRQVAIVEYLTQTQMRRVGYQPVTAGPGMEAWFALNARRGVNRLRRAIDYLQHRRPDLSAPHRSR